MNNVHEEKPTIFETRWAMSYLRGPLTRNQIAQLTAQSKACHVETWEKRNRLILPKPATAGAFVGTLPERPQFDVQVPYAQTAKIRLRMLAFQCCLQI